MVLDRYGFKPIYLQLAEKIHGDIASGVHSPDSQLPTEEVLSKEYEVSRITIRNTLKKLEKEGLIYRVHGKGTFISPSRKKQKNLIGVLSLMPHGDMSLQSLITGAFMRTQEENGQLQLISREQLEKTTAMVKNNPLLQPGFVFLRGDHITPDIARRMESSGIPFLVEGYALQGCNYQDIDNYDAMKKVVEHLIALGHRRFGLFMLDTKAHVHFMERRSAVIETLKEHGIDFDVRLQVSVPENTPKREFYNLTSRFFKFPKPPTAIISVSDNPAAEIIRWLNHHNYKVPEQVSVTGFDDLDFTTYTDPPLTTIRQDYYSLGYKAADLVFKMMDNSINRKIQEKVKLDLVVRNSTGPAADIKDLKKKVNKRILR